MAQLNNLIVTGSSRFLNKAYFSNGGTFNGNINIDNGELQIYGKTALMGYDSWLRINEPRHFTSGIYCGTGTLRTDGAFQVGDNGWVFKVNSSNVICGVGLNASKGLTVSNGANIYGGLLSDSGLTVKNAGLELYFSTPFIDFHFDNSNNDYTSRIIEGNKGVLNINGVTCSSSNLVASNVSATNVNVSSRINADAATAIFNNVYVKDELRSTTWAIDNITNLGSTFYVSPCIIFTNPSVYINSKSGTTVTLTITDNNIISSTIGGQTWTSGSKIKLMGRINTSVLGVVNGTMARQLNTTTAKTAYITLNFATTDDCAGIEQGKTYSGSAVGDLKMMMYEVNLNVNGTTKNRPVGIRMSSYNEDKKSSIDIYNGTVDDGKPIVRMGYLGGLPAVNGENPTGYGFYAVGNAFFSGRIVSSSGKIGGFSLSENTIQNGAWGQSDSVLICTGTNSYASIGGSNSINGWCFTASNTFGVTKTGALYASNATITGNVTATSGRIGNCSIENGTLNITNASSNYAVFEGNGKTNGYFHIATIKIIGNYIDRAMVIGAQSRGYGYSEINLQFINANNTDPGLNFFNQTGRGDWYIKKTATSTWNIYCKKSEAYGYTRILKYIDSPSVTLTWGSGNADLPASSTRATQLAGSSAWCYNNDSTYINGGNIYTGTVTANAIAANAITSDKISAGAITAAKITTDNISGTNGWINLRSGTFSYNDGALAWDGSTMKIGRYYVTKTYLAAGSGSTCVGMGGDQAFWAGNQSSNSAPFRVSYEGNLYASQVNITGTINASSLTAKQYYKIYDSNGKNERTFVSWSGSMLSFGLVSQNGSNEAEIQILPGSQTVTFNGDIGATQGTIYANSINATAIYTNNKNTSMGVNLYTSGTLTVKSGTTLKSTLHVDGESGFYGKVTARSSFAFLDYNAEEDANANAVFRRPIASAGSNKTKVAFLQSRAGNKISIRAQYGSTSWGTATFTGSSSDIRLKRDIKDSSVNALSKIMQMKIREFNWKQTGVHQELGCVADELELIDPLLTTGGGYDDDGTMNIKSIDTLLLSEYAIKGIQELYKQNKQQQKRIEYLESQLNNK